MKKVFMTMFSTILLLVISFSFVGCGSLDGYEGVYECSYLANGGQAFNVNDTYEHYTLTLDGKGNCKASFKMKMAPYTSSDTKSKYEIDGTKFTEIVGKIKNEYKIEDNVITLEYNMQGMSITAKFTKVRAE